MGDTARRRGVGEWEEGIMRNKWRESKGGRNEASKGERGEQTQ